MQKSQWYLLSETGPLHAPEGSSILTTSHTHCPGYHATDQEPGDANDSQGMKQSIDAYPRMDWALQ